MKPQIALFLTSALFLITACTPGPNPTHRQGAMSDTPREQQMMEKTKTQEQMMEGNMMDDESSEEGAMQETWPAGSEMEEGVMDTEMSSGFQLIPYSQAAFEEAKGKRPVAIHFSATWCPKCRALDASLKENMASLPQDAIVFLADYDTETELKKEYGITLQTTVVFFNRNGEKGETINNPPLEKIKALLQS